LHIRGFAPPISSVTVIFVYLPLEARHPCEVHELFLSNNPRQTFIGSPHKSPWSRKDNRYPMEATQEHISVGCNRLTQALAWGADGLAAFGAHHAVALYHPMVMHTVSPSQRPFGIAWNSAITSEPMYNIPYTSLSFHFFISLHIGFF